MNEKLLIRALEIKSEIAEKKEKIHELKTVDTVRFYYRESDKSRNWHELDIPIRKSVNADITSLEWTEISLDVALEKTQSAKVKHILKFFDSEIELLERDIKNLEKEFEDL